MFMRGSVAIATVILMSGINAEVPSAGLCGPGTVLDGGVCTPAQPAAYPKVLNPPKFNWESLGGMVFAHTGQAKEYTQNDLQLLSKFSMVQFDKKQSIANMSQSTQEDRFIEAATQVKAANKDIQIIMYINALINFPASRLHNITKMEPELLLRNSVGELVTTVSPDTTFDLRQAAMRKVFVDDALYGMRSGVFNGVFIDRANWASSSKCGGGRELDNGTGGGNVDANGDSVQYVERRASHASQAPPSPLSPPPPSPSTLGPKQGKWDKLTCESMIPAQRQLFVELSAALGEGNITLAKETSGTPMDDVQVVNAAMTSDTFCSHYCHQCNESTDPAASWVLPNDAQTCADSIEAIANMSARGQLSQSHGMGPFSGTYAKEARLFTMAAFLVGAGNLSYYSHANWATDCWELSGTQWWPEYDLPLGNPTSPPNTKLPGKRWKYHRSFSSGTTIYVDVATRVVNITWGTTSR